MISADVKINVKQQENERIGGYIFEIFIRNTFKT